MPLDIPITIPYTESNKQYIKISEKKNDRGQDNMKNKIKIEITPKINKTENSIKSEDKDLSFPLEKDILNRINQKELSRRIRLCSFNAHKKFEPTSFSVWANILRSNPRAVLILLDSAQDVKENLLNQARYQVRGIRG